MGMRDGWNWIITTVPLLCHSSICVASPRSSSGPSGCTRLSGETRSRSRDLSKLSVWWLRLGIQIERITPGHPQQNGRHERRHLTLKKEATKPAAANVLQQQARFDAFIARYNQERPHQMGRKCYLCLRNELSPM